jgi:hypothetical protein
MSLQLGADLGALLVDSGDRGSEPFPVYNCLRRFSRDRSAQAKRSFINNCGHDAATGIFVRDSFPHGPEAGLNLRRYVSTGRK